MTSLRGFEVLLHLTATVLSDALENDEVCPADLVCAQELDTLLRLLGSFNNDRFKLSAGC
jgi:hypothetical protein